MPNSIGGSMARRRVPPASPAGARAESAISSQFRHGRSIAAKVIRNLFYGAALTAQPYSFSTAFPSGCSATPIDRPHISDAPSSAPAFSVPPPWPHRHWQRYSTPPDDPAGQRRSGSDGLKIYFRYLKRAGLLADRILLSDLARGERACRRGLMLERGGARCWV